MKVVTICGSMKFEDQMKRIAFASVIFCEEHKIIQDLPVTFMCFRIEINETSSTLT